MANYFWKGFIITAIFFFFFLRKANAGETAVLHPDTLEMLRIKDDWYLFKNNSWIFGF